MYFLNIYKPVGMTSFDVIARLRKILKIKQIGHSGTLDPLADGVLQIAVGNATKLLDYLKSDKEYIATLKFGYTSTTYDEEGKKTFIKEPDFTYKELEKIIKTFIGKTNQIPPKYSAIKVNGKKLCDEARINPNLNIEIKARDIEIYDIEILDFNLPYVKIKTNVKKGTYIRSLANDIGEKLDCGAYITQLTRTKAGNFEIKDSDKLENNKFNEINPIDCLNLPTKVIKDDEYNKIKNGNFIANDTDFKGEILLINNNKLVSLAKIDDNIIKPRKNFKD